MRKIDIEALKRREPHVLKAFLRKNRVPQGRLAEELGLSQCALNIALNGLPCSKKIKNALDELAEAWGVSQ